MDQPMPPFSPPLGIAPLDFGALATEFTPIADAAAAEIAARVFGLQGALKRLETEKDDTFRLTTEGGVFILKIANPGESLAELDLQARALLHIARADPGLPVPRIIPALDGAILPQIEDRGSLRHLRLMSFLPGTVLDTVDPLPAERHQIGQLLARLRHAMADFSHPEAGRVLAWDVRHLPGAAGLIEHVGDPAQRRALEAGLGRFTALMPRIEQLRRQVLHNDFSRSNLLVDRSGPPRVVGVIDFGDVVHTAIAIDVSTAMLNQLPRDAAGRQVDDLFFEAREVLAGYRELADLSDEELALIPHLVMGRVVVRALLSLWRAGMFPENRRYLLRNTEQGWAQLDWFLARSPDQISSLLL